MELDQILPNLYLGSCPRTPVDVDRLREQFGITAVLNVQTRQDFAAWGIDWPALEARYRAAGIELRHVPVCDFDPEDLRRCLPGCVRALDELLKAGHTVFVHCSAGVNRSPSTVLAWLHWVDGRPLDEAHAHLSACRSCDPYLDPIRLASDDWRKETGRAE